MDGRSDHQEAFQSKPPVLNLDDGKETLFCITGFFGRSQLVIDGFSKKKNSNAEMSYFILVAGTK